jgi:hypothetical protein
MQIPDWVKPAAWGAVGGIVVVAIVAFSAGWIVTSGSAQESAQRQAEKAVIAALTPVCVAKFRTETQEQQTTHLAALQDESSWQRGDYVEEQGWATMPGGTEPNDEVAEVCASELMKLAEA